MQEFSINTTIIDKDVDFRSDTTIGYELEQDNKRFFVEEQSNIIVISKALKFPA
jgi:ADP-glucose pyrophosphorylase